MDPQATEFSELLLKHAKGRAHTQASNLLREAVEAVRRTGKKATVSVQFEISTIKNNPRVLEIGDKVTARIPEQKECSIWYPDDDGGLHRNDPEQLRIDYPQDGKSASAGRDN